MLPWYLQLILYVSACSLIGWATNVIAVRMIFRPRQPRRWLGLRFQGVLPKHQDHFARQMAESVTKDLITTGEMVRRLDAVALYALMGPAIDEVVAVVVEEVRAGLPEAQRPLLSAEVIKALRKQLEQELEKELPQLIEALSSRADQLVDLGDLIAEKLIAIGPARLEDLIRRVAQRELSYIEWYGGFFGLFMGFGQFGLARLFAVEYSALLVGAAVGAVTNYLAIQMLFLPRHPTRVLLVQVQGLFPKRQNAIARELAIIAAEGFVVAQEIFALLGERLLPRRLSLEQLSQAEAYLIARVPPLGALLSSLLGPEARARLWERLADHYQQRWPGLAAQLAEAAAAQLDVRSLLDQKLTGMSKLHFEELLRGLFKREEVYLVIYGALLGALMGALQIVVPRI